MQGGRWLATSIVGLLFGLLPSMASAVNPETLLMPGKLARAHAKYEEQCSLCHDRNDRDRQTTLCLDCHKDIAGDLHQQRGFHGHVERHRALAVPRLPLRAPRARGGHRQAQHRAV